MDIAGPVGPRNINGRSTTTFELPELELSQISWFKSAVWTIDQTETIRIVGFWTLEAYLKDINLVLFDMFTRAVVLLRLLDEPPRSAAKVITHRVAKVPVANKTMPEMTFPLGHGWLLLTVFGALSESVSGGMNFPQASAASIYLSHHDLSCVPCCRTIS